MIEPVAAVAAPALALPPDTHADTSAANTGHDERTREEPAIAAAALEPTREMPAETKTDVPTAVTGEQVSPPQRKERRGWRTALGVAAGILIGAALATAGTRVWPEMRAALTARNTPRTAAPHASPSPRYAADSTALVGAPRGRAESDSVPARMGGPVANLRSAASSAASRRKLTRAARAARDAFARQPRTETGENARRTLRHTPILVEQITGDTETDHVRQVVRAPQSLPPETREPEFLRTFILAHESSLRACFTDARFRANPGLTVTVALALSIAPAGQVSARVVRRSWEDAGVARPAGAGELESCVVDRLERLSLPPASWEGSEYSVSVSFGGPDPESSAR
jgi:hypothetical protein